MYMVGGPLDDKRTSFLFASKQPDDDDDDKNKKEETKRLFQLGKNIGKKLKEKEEQQARDKKNK